MSKIRLVGKNDDKERRVRVMAVSVKPTPIFKGEDAKKFLENMDNPKYDKDFFDNCKELSKIFKVKK